MSISQKFEDYIAAMRKFQGIFTADAGGAGARGPLQLISTQYVHRKKHVFSSSMRVWLAELQVIPEAMCIGVWPLTLRSKESEVSKGYKKKQEVGLCRHIKSDNTIESVNGGKKKNQNIWTAWKK